MPPRLGGIGQTASVKWLRRRGRDTTDPPETRTPAVTVIAARGKYHLTPDDLSPTFRIAADDRSLTLPADASDGDIVDALLSVLAYEPRIVAAPSKEHPEVYREIRTRHRKTLLKAFEVTRSGDWLPEARAVATELVDGFLVFTPSIHDRLTMESFVWLGAEFVLSSDADDSTAAAEGLREAFERCQ
jgi:hypothetical protein